MRPNLTKRKIASGRPAFGLGIGLVSPALVEVCAYAGFDFLLVDAEHSAVNEQEYENLVRVAEAADMTPCVRVPRVPEQIGRLLDIGMQGVWVTHVGSKADAALAVRSAKYPPEGERGVAGSSRASRYGLDYAVGEYSKRANEETMVVAMIEDKEGIQNLSEILATDGVDAFNIGPSDLANSLGLAGHPEHPRVQSMLSETIDEILRFGKVLGVGGRDPEKTASFLNQGAKLVVVSLTDLVQKASSEYLQQWSEYRSTS